MLDIGRHIYGRTVSIVIFYFQFSVVNIFIIPKLENVRTISLGQIIRQKDEVMPRGNWYRDLVMQ